MTATLNDGSTKSRIKQQLKLVKKMKIDPVAVLREATVRLQEKYTMKRQSQCEVVFKRKLDDSIESDAFSALMDVIGNDDLDVELLFRVISKSNELIIQIKRMNEE